MRSTAAIRADNAAAGLAPTGPAQRPGPDRSTPLAACSLALKPDGQEARDRAREERAVELCQCMMEIVAALFNVPSRELHRTARGGLAAARIRQIAMYVAHVAFSLSMSEVGLGFGRDRTTVRHACHLIEDMRDDADFDAIVVTAERVARAALRQRSGV